MKCVTFMVKTFEGGGAQRVIQTLTRYFVSQDIEVQIVTLFWAKSYDLSESVRVWNIDADRSDLSVEHNSLQIQKTSEFRKAHETDFVIICSTSAPLYRYALELQKENPFKIIAAMTNAPEFSPRTLQGRQERDLIFEQLCQNNSGFIFQTPHERDYFHPDIRRESVIIDNPITQEISAPYCGPRTKEIVSAGRYDEQKNFELLIRAFGLLHKTYPDYTLKIYGRGHMEQEYIRLIKELELEEFVLLKPFTLNIHEEIKKSAMFVQSSDYEGVSNILLECIVLGLPVISTDCPAYGAREFITDGFNGLLVEPNNDRQLCDAMIKVIQTPEFVENAQSISSSVKERLDIECVGKAYVAYMNRLGDK